VSLLFLCVKKNSNSLKMANKGSQLCYSYGKSKVFHLEGVQSQSDSYREQMKLPNMERV